MYAQLKRRKENVISTGWCRIFIPMPLPVFLFLITKTKLQQAWRLALFFVVVVASCSNQFTLKNHSATSIINKLKWEKPCQNWLQGPISKGHQPYHTLPHKSPTEPNKVVCTDLYFGIELDFLDLSPTPFNELVWQGNRVLTSRNRNVVMTFRLELASSKLLRTFSLPD